MSGALVRLPEHTGIVRDADVAQAIVALANAAFKWGQFVGEHGPLVVDNTKKPPGEWALIAHHDDAIRTLGKVLGLPHDMIERIVG